MKRLIEKHAITPCLFRALVGLFSFGLICNSFAAETSVAIVSAAQPTPPPAMPETYAGYALINRTNLVDERDCEQLDIALLNLNDAILLDFIYSEQRDAKATRLNDATIALDLKNSDVAILSDTREQQGVLLASAIETLSQMEEATEAAKQIYRECRREASREECEVEYDEYSRLRSIERDYEENTLEPLEQSVESLDDAIEAANREIVDLENEITDIQAFLSLANAAAEDVRNRRRAYIATYQNPGEFTQFTFYGNIEDDIDVLNARILLHGSNNYDGDNGAPIGILGSFDSLPLFDIGNSPASMSFEWPLSHGFDEISAPLREQLNSGVSASLEIDGHYSCDILAQTDINFENFTPTLSLVLDSVRTLSVSNRYLIHVNTELAIQDLVDLANSMRYVVASDLANFHFSDAAFSIDVLEMVSEAEAVAIRETFARDFLHSLLVHIAVPAPDVQSDTCSSSMPTSACRIVGWWLNGLGVSDIPSLPVAPYSVEVSNTFNLRERIVISAVKDAPLPLVCADDEILVDGVCEPINPPTCPEVQILVDGDCVDAPPIECAEGYALVDGQCELILVCGDGQDPVDGVCPDALPECDAGEVLEDGVCVPETPVCPEGSELIDGVCVNTSLGICPPGQVLVGPFCETP